MGIPLLLFTGRSAFSTGIKKKIGILKETKNRWECRVPLTPENIKELRDDPNLKDKLEFYIQPSRKRIFQDAEYIKVRKDGCNICIHTRSIYISQRLVQVLKMI